MVSIPTCHVIIALHQLKRVRHALTDTTDGLQANLFNPINKRAQITDYSVVSYKIDWWTRAILFKRVDLHVVFTNFRITLEWLAGYPENEWSHATWWPVYFPTHVGLAGKSHNELLVFIFLYFSFRFKNCIYFILRKSVPIEFGYV